MVSSGSRRTKTGKQDSRHRGKDKFMGAHHLQRIVDVGKVRILVWCRKSSGWTTSDEIWKRLKNPCGPTNQRVAYQVQKLEQGMRLGRIAE